ncbi:MAG: hypothetical protein ACHQHN_16765 [Sphingobacteriales bacterium]
MGKPVILLFSVLFICGISACKKDAKPKVPSSLIGEWYIRQYTITTTTNGSAASPFVYFRSDTATNVYYLFNGDGTGLEQLNFDPAFIKVPATGFSFRISGSNIVFSQNSTVLQSPTCSFEMPTSGTLVIRSTYSSTDNFGNVISTLQELNLGK